MSKELQEIKKLAINTYIAPKYEHEYDLINYDNGEYHYMYSQEEYPLHVIVERKLNQIIEVINELVRERNENLQDEG